MAARCVPFGFHTGLRQSPIVGQAEIFTGMNGQVRYPFVTYVIPQILHEIRCETVYPHIPCFGKLLTHTSVGVGGGACRVVWVAPHPSTEPSKSTVSVRNQAVDDPMVVLPMITTS